MMLADALQTGPARYEEGPRTVNIRAVGERFKVEAKFTHYGYVESAIPWDFVIRLLTLWEVPVDQFKN